MITMKYIGLFLMEALLAIVCAKSRETAAKADFLYKYGDGSTKKGSNKVVKGGWQVDDRCK